MKVAVAIWFPSDPSAPRGGVEAVSVNLVRALVAIPGNDVHVVTCDTGVREIQAGPWEGAILHRLPQPPGSLLGFAKGEGRAMLQNFLRRLKPDVVHSHDTFGIMTRGLDLPRVFTIHGFIHEDTQFVGGWKARLRSLLWKREELATWAEQPHIISISPYVRERLRGIARGVIHDIENPIDSACFDVPRGEESGRVFSAAVICRRKNQQGLVDAVARLSPSVGVKLRLAGPAVEANYAKAVEDSICDKQLQSRVELLGSISGDRVREELARAAVFALTSFEEGAPMGIAEAMAAGVPILTSNRCGMPYMVRHGETGFLVDPHDFADIARCLELLLGDTVLRQRMGDAAKVRALDGFHPDRVAARTMAVYERAIRWRND